MRTYRHKLPQLNGDQYITDGGLETTLIFLHGIDLPHFAAFDLYSREGGTGMLKAYYEDYIEIAKNTGEASFWKVPPGGAIPAGLTNWAMIPKALKRSTGTQ